MGRAQSIANNDGDGLCHLLSLGLGIGDLGLRV